MDLGLRAPPRVGVALAAMSWMVMHVIAAQTSPTASQATGNTLSIAQQSVIHLVAGWAQYAVPFCLLVGVVVSRIRSRRARKVFANARRNPNAAIARMSWRDFEQLVGESFRLQGFTVLELGGGGPDGGIDLILTKDGKRYLGQCKHWKAWQVGVTVVRELNGVIAAQKADGGYVITGGAFSEDAVAFAESCGIKLVDGPKLEALIQSVRSKVSPTVEEVIDVPPKCPDCGAVMREKTATQGQFKGQPFWSCTAYPKCRGIVHIERVA